MVKSGRYPVTAAMHGIGGCGAHMDTVLAMEAKHLPMSSIDHICQTRSDRGTFGSHYSCLLAMDSSIQPGATAGRP
jgi:hypothetical protein